MGGRASATQPVPATALAVRGEPSVPWVDYDACLHKQRGLGSIVLLVLGGIRLIIGAYG